MPRYKKPGSGRDFLKGVSGNPNGRPKDPPELKVLKKMTKGELELLFYKLLLSKPEELKDFNKSVLELWLANGAKKAIEQGDYNRLMILIDRLHGKVSNVVEVKNYKEMSDEELLLEAEKEVNQFKQSIEAKYKETP